MSIAEQCPCLNKTKSSVYDQHISHISKKMLTFYQEKLFCDIVLTSEIDNFQIHAHRNVLSAFSSFFLAMFHSSMIEKTSHEVKLAIDGVTLKLLIDFIYSGTLEITCSNCESLLKAADFLELNTVQSACCHFMAKHIDPTNCLGIAIMAEKYCFIELYNAAIELALKRFDDVCLEEEFLQLNGEQLCKIISSDKLCVQSEEVVFHKLVDWLEHDKVNRYKFILELLSHVRFSFLSSEFIRNNRHSIDGCYELMGTWLEMQLTTNHCERGKQKQKLIFISGFWTNTLKLQTFDAESNIWSLQKIPREILAMSYFNSIVINRKLIMTGRTLNADRNDVVSLDLETKQCTNLAPMLKQRDCPGIAELNGNLYVVGGRIDGIWTQSMEKYDFCTREWQEMAPMHMLHTFLCVTVVDGLLYAVGDGSSPIESYNPTNNEWSQIASKNEKSLYFGIAGVGGRLYAVGGEFNGVASKTVERYNPSIGSWTVVSPGLRLGLYSLICASWNDRLIVCRGVDAHNQRTNLVEEYDPEANKWRSLAPLLPLDLESSSCSLHAI